MLKESIMIRIQRTRVVSVCRDIVTCGNEGDVKRWCWERLTNEYTVELDGEVFAIAMSTKGTCIAVSVEDNKVLMFSFPNLVFMSLVTQDQVQLHGNQ
jgi:hypothetical protein